MEIEDEEEDDYGLYIEELKSENPNLKFNAAQKIVNIAKVLGNNSFILLMSLRRQKNKRGIYTISDRYNRRLRKRR